MALVEGIGDEVLVCAAVLLIVFLIIIAWLSTSIQDIPFINVIIIELTHRSGRANRSGDAANASGGASQTGQSATNSTETPSESGHQESEDSRDLLENASPLVKQSTLNLGEGGSAPATSVSESEVSVAGASGQSDHSVNTHAGSCGQNDESSDTLCKGNDETRTSVNGGSLEDRSDTEQAEDSHQDSDSLWGSSNYVTAESQSDERSIEGGIGQTENPDPISLTETELRKRRLAFFENKSSDDRTDCSEGKIGPAFVSTESKSNETAATYEPITMGTSPLNSDRKSETPSREYEPDSQSPTQRRDSQESLHRHGDSEPIEAEVEMEGQQIRVRLKYLNDTQRQVVASPSDTIGNFRRTHFAPELDEDKLVRFIFNGQDLRNDTFTLQAYNIVDNSVIHCLITQASHTLPPVQTDNHGEFDIGRLMFPLFALILGVIWYLRFSYRQYFNATTTLSLVGISFMFLMSYIASWNRTPREHLHLD